MHIDYPFHIDASGRTAATSNDDHLRDMIEQVLFTSPGERVNRPEFGSGLLQLLFAPASEELASATQYLLAGSLTQFLGDLIVVEQLQVETDEAAIRVSVRYQIRRTGEIRVSHFGRST